MADEAGSLSDKGRIAEHVVGMSMGVDDVADRLAGAGPYRGEQRLAFAEAAPRIDHGHRVLTDNETDIGNGALVLSRHQRDGAGMDEDSRRDFTYRQFGWPGTCCASVPIRAICRSRMKRVRDSRTRSPGCLRKNSRRSSTTPSSRRPPVS